MRVYTYDINKEIKAYFVSKIIWREFDTQINNADVQNLLEELPPISEYHGQTSLFILLLEDRPLQLNQT